MDYLNTNAHLEAEVARLQREVVSRNARALEGDKAVAARERLVDEIERLRLAACGVAGRFLALQNMRSGEMTTDRELLEMAAKAANQERSAAGDLWSNARGMLWNPIDDDGDAMRLAVKLKLIVEFEERTQHEWSHIVWVAPVFEPLQGDPYAATRRAIVRAAAEIGRSLP
jgi:hypothetical protein